MIVREMAAELALMAKEYPVVTVVGARQAGKTTLTCQVFPKKPYVNMELPENQLLAQEDPQAFLDQYPDGVILDEIQTVPFLLSYIQVRVDARKKNGLYILTGSHQLDLYEQVSQSLAGRTAILNLLPLSYQEIINAGYEFELDELLLKGCFPRVYDQSQTPTKAYRFYLQTYLERDVRRMIHLKDLTTFQKFITLCASRIGQLINFQSMSEELGVSGHTIKHWLSILEASFIIFRLQPYYKNIGKRIIKSHKLYFVDVGLAAYLLGIETVTQIKRDPLRGQLFENFVILDLIKRRYNQGLDHRLYFYRDQQQREIDVVYQKAAELVPIEIKSGKTYHSEFMKNIDYFSQLFPDQCKNGYLVYAGDQTQQLGWRKLINYKMLHDIFS